MAECNSTEINLRGTEMAVCYLYGRETEFDKIIVFQSYFPQNCDSFLNFREFSKAFGAF